LSDTHLASALDKATPASLEAPLALTPRTDALLSKWDDDGASRGSAFLELAQLARHLEQTIANLSGGPLRISGRQLKQALALACPDGESDLQQEESIVFLEHLAQGQATAEDTGADNPAGIYLTFDDNANDPGLYLLEDFEGAAAAEMAQAARPLDNCQVCRGARGGVLGNENVIAGVVVCDYCHADESYLPKTVEAAYEMGAIGAPHNEQERLRFEGYMRGHCWKVGTWLPEKSYYDDMTTRMLFAVWRDRAALRG
jgi:hypothetical protein